MKTSEMFDRAADLLEQHGWNQGAYFGYDGSHCMVGALQESSGAYHYEVERLLSCGSVVMKGINCNQTLDPDIMRSFCKAYDILLCYVLNEADCVETWNDTGGRTKKQVVFVLRTAATLQRKVENSVVLPVVTPELEPA